MSDNQENVLTDHAYDGIQEYDNPMPGWWVWSFILTILFAVPYWAWFHLSEGHSIYDELAAAVVAAENSAPKLDESPEAMLGYLSDPEILAKGKAVFLGTGICASCHVADGGGLVGPNLTDDSYIHVKQISDIMSVVRKGVIEKGMPAREGSLRQQEIVAVAAYVASMRGTTPASPKAAEGEVIAPWQ